MILVYTQSLHRGHDTRLIFKQSPAGLIEKFSFL